jgi:hypothetical protein
MSLAFILKAHHPFSHATYEVLEINFKANDNTSFCHMVKFTTSDWRRHTFFFRVDACQLVNSKMEIKRFHQILTYHILEPQRRYGIVTVKY